MEWNGAVGEDVARALRVELEAVARGDDLGGEQLGARLAGLGGDPHRELVRALGEQARGAIEIVRALAEAGRAPVDLRLARALDRGAHLLRAVDLELAE